MTRKIRKEVTEELKKLIQRLSQDETKTIKQIAAIADVNRNVVSRIIRDLPTSTPRSVPPQIIISEERTRKVTLKNQIIRNITVCQNDLTQKEIADELFVKAGVRKSRAAICRNLKKKQGTTRKRLSLVPEERNTEEKINLRAIYSLFKK